MASSSNWWLLSWHKIRQNFWLAMDQEKTLRTPGSEKKSHRLELLLCCFCKLWQIQAALDGKIHMIICLLTKLNKETLDGKGILTYFLSITRMQHRTKYDCNYFAVLSYCLYAELRLYYPVHYKTSMFVTINKKKSKTKSWLWLKT